MSTFSIIATPIGNLEDITLRALKTLANADLILCEDTRVTKKLLDRHNIKKPTKSYHAHSKLSRVGEIISLLKGDAATKNSPSTSPGKNIALVSDAGTPGISDPGSELVKHIRRELENEIRSGEIKIEAIPGPSALTSALSIAGVPCADFTFLGFLPHKKGRETLFKEIVASERTMVFYESPHRIMKTLESLMEHLNSGRDEISEINPRAKRTEPSWFSQGSSPKKVTVCRELTKVFEEVVQGTPKEVKNYFEEHADKVRGEFVVIVSE